MNRDEFYLARVLIKLKILSKDQQSYEDLFTRIMQNNNLDFQPVKPQGRYGDKKNDGFDKNTGYYYQVYAPEDLQKREQDAIDKLTSDFKGLMEYWTSAGYKINKYFFVVNDKYKGVYPSLHKSAKQIEEEYKIKTEIFRNKHLEEVFLNLDENKIIEIIGPIPNPLDIDVPDYDIMNEVISHLLDQDILDDQESIPEDPDFEKKIIFNSLSSAVGNFLNTGRLYNHIINDYFELNSDFVKEELRLRFNNLYKTGMRVIPDCDTKNDELFFFIHKKSSPLDKLAIKHAVYIIMAYYFEYCDIFETPTTIKKI